MLKSDDLKAWLHKDLARLDKLLLVLATQDAPTSVSQVFQIAAAAGFRDPKNKKWNVSAILGAQRVIMGRVNCRSGFTRRFAPKNYRNMAG